MRHDLRDLASLLESVIDRETRPWVIGGAVVGLLVAAAAVLLGFRP